MTLSNGQIDEDRAVENGSDRIVIDDGIQPSKPTQSADGRWLWLLVGVGLGIGMSLLFAASGFVAPGQDPDPGGGTSSTETTLPASAGIGDVLPGFPDGLNVIISPGSGRALEVLTWPLQGEQINRSIALSDLDLADTPRFDTSGEFVAAGSAVGDQTALHAGRPNTFSVVAADVNGFAWHDTAPGDLAWSTMVDGRVQVMLSDDFGEAELAVDAEGISGALTTFGDWGYAVVGSADGDESETVRSFVFDPEGDSLVELDGRIMASHASSGLLVEREGKVFLVPLVDGRPVPNSEIELDLSNMEGQVALGGSFSPDGRRIAVTGFIGVLLIDLEPEGEAVNYPIRAGSDSIGWSSDGRFLLVSSFRGVNVVDTEDGSIESILSGLTTRAVTVVPIGGP